jgi:CheY-like chemotaxis protein
MLPGLEGPEVLATLRAEGHRTPVLMLTARTTLPDRVRGLDSGADDGQCASRSHLVAAPAHSSKGVSWRS